VDQTKLELTKFYYVSLRNHRVRSNSVGRSLGFGKLDSIYNLTSTKTMASQHSTSNFRKNNRIIHLLDRYQKYNKRTSQCLYLHRRSCHRLSIHVPCISQFTIHLSYFAHFIYKASSALTFFKTTPHLITPAIQGLQTHDSTPTSTAMAKRSCSNDIAVLGRPTKKQRPAITFSSRPTQVLKVFVCGAGDFGEMGRPLR
jgi:hypothetical protein